MDNSIQAARHKQFKTIYRLIQMVDNGRYIFKEKHTLEEITASYKSSPHYLKIVDLEGEKMAEFYIWWVSWIVFLYIEFGPGKSEAAWEFFLESITEKEGGAE